MVLSVTPLLELVIGELGILAKIALVEAIMVPDIEVLHSRGGLQFKLGEAPNKEGRLPCYCPI